jgi:hypothetical protein
MGMDLRGAGGNFRFPVHGWSAVLHLARDFGGWEPQGTEPPEYYRQRALADGEPLDWSGTYGTNDYQQVTEADARNLADALERALRHVPRERTWEKGVIHLPEGGIVETMPDDLNPPEHFSGPEGRRYLEEFIRYCRAGSFVIGRRSETAPPPAAVAVSRGGATIECEGRL